MKATPKPGRGHVEDLNVILGAILDSWDFLQEAQNGLGAEEAAYKDYFNNLCKEYDDLGEMLFGDVQDFDDLV